MLDLMTLFHPMVDLPLLRLMSFVGIIFGLVNIITWFVISPERGGADTLQVDLLLISVYGFVLSLDRFSSVDTVV